MAYDAVHTYLQEADELIADIEESALALNAADAPAETVNRLFRAFHTIKGSGAMCGLDAVAAFTHHVENLLENVRAGAVPVSSALTDIVLQAADHIKFLLAASQGGPPPSADSAGLLLAAIEKFANLPAAPARSVPASSAPSADEPLHPERTWQIRFRPDPSLLATGGSPVPLLRELRKLGPCEIVAHVEDVPPVETLQPDRCYFWWSVNLKTSAGVNAIRDIFIFAEDGATLEIEPATAGLSSTAPRDTSQAAPPLAKDAMVRVPAERLDRLVNLVGEFVMTQSSMAQLAAQTGVREFAGPVQALERLVAELRDSVLGIRMLPIGTLFGRFRRVVHDLSAELGKQADLIAEGGETELDKSVLDQLGDPLVHCLRNSLDHGIEPADDRVLQGKPPRGTIRLSAVHAGSNVVVTIEDDGRGIDRQAVRAKAIEKGLISPEANLSENDILNLILSPGFSTARQVTSVSGRGVGMDAVRRQIDLLRGSLSLSGAAGQGTCVSITLPLTLAIIDGLLVQVGRERFILPMAVVCENVEISGADRDRYNGRNLLAVRGQLIPYIDLREAFAIRESPPAIEKTVIVQYGADRVGLVVDRVLGTHQTVVQPVGRFYKRVEAVSGATIMGDGCVALVLDVSRLIQFAGHPPASRAPRFSSAT